jgi:hypothetical protein
VLAFACSNRASGSTHRSSQSNANAVLIPSKFNAFPQHTLSSGCFYSHLLFRLLSKFPRKQFSLFLSDVRTRTLVRTESKQSKEGRHPLSLSPPHTDHRRIARSPCQNATESPIIFIPVEGPFFQVNLSDGPSRSLSHSLSVPSISLSLYIEVFSKDELQLSHQSVMGGQPVSRRGHEKLLFFQQSTTAPSENVFRFSTTELNRPFRSEFVFLPSLTRVRQK